MTEPTIRLKKSNLAMPVLMAMCTLVFLTLRSGTAHAQNQAPKLPVLQQVGAIPVQWEEGSDADQTYNLDAAKKWINDAFPVAVRHSRRFRVLSDELIGTLWKDPKGREELRDQFELNAFVSLNAAAQGDGITLTARLLTTTMTTMMLESERLPISWLGASDQAAITEKVEHLVFRLFNRIPIDVSVTSVQGAFITLSGGTEQGVEPGDKVDIIRARIKSLHPANGSWLSFETEPLGTAIVLDVKTFTSVAKIQYLTYDGAVQVGDGAKIPAIAGRVKFARMDKKPDFKDSGSQKTIIVPPMYTAVTPPGPAAQPEKKSGDPTAAVPEEIVAANPEITTPPTEPAKEEAKEELAAEEAEEEEKEKKDEESFWSDFNFKMPDIGNKVVDDLVVYAGPYWWKATGPYSASGKFPILLLNSAGVKVTRQLVHKIRIGFGGGVMFGSSQTSSYTGYESHARLYWEDQLNVGTPLLTSWRAGGHATFSGLTTKERFGGGDWIRGGGFGGLGGTLSLMNGTQRLDWFSEFGLMPMNIGRVGYDGSRHAVESASEWNFKVGAFNQMRIFNMQLGGSIEISDDRETLNNSRRYHIQDWRLSALAKMAF